MEKRALRTGGQYGGAERVLLHCPDAEDHRSRAIALQERRAVSGLALTRLS
jgi:hypothetical protein